MFWNSIHIVHGFSDLHIYYGNNYSEFMDKALI